MKDHRPVLGDEVGGNYIKVNTGSHEAELCSYWWLPVATIQNMKFILGFDSFSQAICLRS